MTEQEAAQKLKDFQSQIDTMKKDFELKLDSVTKSAESWKSVAEQKQEEIKTLAEKNKKIQEDSDKATKEMREKENKQFAEALVETGRITPAQRDMVFKLMESMTSDVEIAKWGKNKDGSFTSHTQLSLFKEIVNSLAVKKSGSSRSTSELTKMADDTNSRLTPDNASSANGGETVSVHIYGEGRRDVPLDEADLAAKAFEYQAEQRKIGSIIDYATALLAVAPRKIQA